MFSTCTERIDGLEWVPTDWQFGFFSQHHVHPVLWSLSATTTTTTTTPCFAPLQYFVQSPEKTTRDNMSQPGHSCFSFTSSWCVPYSSVRPASVCARTAHGWKWKEGFVTCQLSPCADVNTCDRRKTEASTLCHCRRRQSERRVIRSAVSRLII